MIPWCGPPVLVWLVVIHNLSKFRCQRPAADYLSIATRQTRSLMTGFLICSKQCGNTTSVSFESQSGCVRVRTRVGLVVGHVTLCKDSKWILIKQRCRYPISLHCAPQLARRSQGILSRAMGLKVLERSHGSFFGANRVM